MIEVEGHHPVPCFIDSSGSSRKECETNSSKE